MSSKKQPTPQVEENTKDSVESNKTQEVNYSEDIASLRSRIEKIERKQSVIVDGFSFAANEVRPLYGFGAVALVFDAIYKKLAE